MIVVYELVHTCMTDMFDCLIAIRNRELDCMVKLVHMESRVSQICYSMWSSSFASRNGTFQLVTRIIITVSYALNSTVKSLLLYF